MVLAALFSFAAAFGGTVADFEGNKFESKSFERIVTLAPSLAEWVLDFGIEESRIVGVSQHTDATPGLKSKAKVGNYTGISLESVIRLKPDLVLATRDGNSPRDVSRLIAMGVPVFVVDSRTLDDWSKTLSLLGQLFGLPAREETLRQRWQKAKTSLQEVGAKLRDKKLTCLIQVGSVPLIVAGGISYLSEIFHWLGFENIFAQENRRYFRPQMEEVLARNPDFLFLLPTGVTLAQTAKDQWTSLHEMRAVKKNQILFLDNENLLRPSMRLVEGLEYLKRTVSALSLK